MDDGAFVVISTNGNGAYAYPSSSRATLAQYMPDRIAQGMAQSADNFAASHPAEIIKAYNQRCKRYLHFGYGA
jgi:hypothetical protein